MVQIILVCAVCMLALAGGVLAWWVDNGGTFKRDKDNVNNEIEKSEPQNSEPQKSESQKSKSQKNDSHKNKSKKNNRKK
ncbi:MAG: hypothetical protein K2K09_05270 [Lachnospiraceae bacterium]|nr:hypothetical protein [Lachnospiraceae bacterium]